MSFIEIMDALSKPIILSLLTLIWTSFVATTITAKWQRRAYLHQLKLQYAESIIKSYHAYVRHLKNVMRSKERHDDDYDVVHTSLLSEAKIVGFLFKEKALEKGWLRMVSNLTNCRTLLLEGQEDSAKDQLERIYEDATSLIRITFEKVL